jgi:hypothetical protein
MPTPDWYPSTLQGLPPFHANVHTQALLNGTMLNLSVGQVTQIGIDADVVDLLIDYDEEVRAFTQAWTEFRNIMLRGDMTAPLPAVPTPPALLDLGEGGAAPGVEERTRLFRGIVLASPGYTPAIGEAYQFVAPAGGDPGEPEVEVAALTQSQMELSITKAGYSVLAVDRRINGGAWVQIGVATIATYLDGDDPLVPGAPEFREYRVQGLVDNVRTGPVSAVAGAWTTP